LVFARIIFKVGLNGIISDSHLGSEHIRFALVPTGDLGGSS